VNHRRQRGFTLIELMVALVVSSLLVGMILAIFSRMSLAYRGQQQIAGVQQVLAAARATIELDAKQAGLAMPQGFTMARGKPRALYSPVQITNSNTGPDQIAFFYADPTTQGAVINVSSWPGTLTLQLGSDSVAGFSPGDLVVMSTVIGTTPNLVIPPPLPSSPPRADLVTYSACILQISPGGVVAGPPNTVTLTFVDNPPWGTPGFAHCATSVPEGDDKPPRLATPTAAGTMIYKLVAHAYRIDPDPARAAIGPLQGALVTGGLPGTTESDWTDLAYGFTDIQTALQVYDDSDSTDTPDPDSDGYREWYSGGTQDTMTGLTRPTSASFGLLQISISLVARTDRDVEGVATAATPQLVDPAIPDNNTIGDHPSVALPWAADPTLPGRIYRSTTFQVDFRNLGAGR
jgi:prepilin-type N-terminal cleavage/methylation domain-containing protein